MDHRLNIFCVECMGYDKNGQKSRMLDYEGKNLAEVHAGMNIEGYFTVGGSNDGKGRIFMSFHNDHGDCRSIICADKNGNREPITVAGFCSEFQV